MEIKISQQELELLKKAIIFSSNNNDLIKNELLPKVETLNSSIKGNNDFIDNLRNVVSDYLQYIGFSKDDQITPDGIILENLIDKFFVD